VSRPAWRERTLADLLDEHGLDGLSEEPFPTDGWSGATFTSIRRGTERFVLKRTSARLDWIVRATLDQELREADVAASPLPSLRGGAPSVPYHGAAADGDGAAILMPDLSTELIAWERPAHASGLPVEDMDRVIDAVARLHALPWWFRPPAASPVPWCPVRERLLLLTRPSAERYRAEGTSVGERLVAGWDAFDRRASPAGRELVDRLSGDPTPLLAALDRLPPIGLHGDLKLANVALLPDRGIAFIDWQMTCFAPVAVELGWLLVSNVDLLPEQPANVLSRYHDSIRRHAGRTGAHGIGRLDFGRIVGEWDVQLDLVWIVGLVLRGWRKGLDAEAGRSLASGVAAVDDLASWCALAVEAANRRL